MLIDLQALYHVWTAADGVFVADANRTYKCNCAPYTVQHCGKQACRCSVLYQDRRTSDSIPVKFKGCSDAGVSWAAVQNWLSKASRTSWAWLVL